MLKNDRNLSKRKILTKAEIYYSHNAVSRFRHTTTSAIWRKPQFSDIYTSMNHRSFGMKVGDVSQKLLYILYYEIYICMYTRTLSVVLVIWDRSFI